MLKIIFKSRLTVYLILMFLIFFLIGFSAIEENSFEKFRNIFIKPFAVTQEFISGSVNDIKTYLYNMEQVSMDAQRIEELYKIISNLENENRKLNRYRQENEELRKLVNQKEQLTEYDFLGADIIAKDPGNFFYTFNINKGSRDGVYFNAPVISSRGIVGRVSKVWEDVSQVVTILEEDSASSGVISKTRDLVLIYGDYKLKKEGSCIMEYIPSEAELTIGDTVETSGIGGIYPRGLLIGTVTQIRKSGDELKNYAVIKPATDFKRMEEVTVLLQKQAPENNEDQYGQSPDGNGTLP